MCVRLTGQCADHGESGEGAGQPLSTHDGSGVRGGQYPRQAEQTALKNRPERWEQDERLKDEFTSKNVTQKTH